jgi:hypothetical protein
MPIGFAAMYGESGSSASLRHRTPFTDMMCCSSWEPWMTRNSTLSPAYASSSGVAGSPHIHELKR